MLLFFWLVVRSMNSYSGHGAWALPNRMKLEAPV